MNSPFGEERQKLIEQLTLALLYLTHWEEDIHGVRMKRSWKGYNFAVLNKLREEGIILDENRSKSVYLTQEGIEVAKNCAANFSAQGSIARTHEIAKLAADTVKNDQKTPPKAIKNQALILRLEFCDLGDDLTCWHTIRVPSTCTFFDLHFIIQTLGNWLDYHIYEFQQREKAPLLLAPLQEDDEGFWEDFAKRDGLYLADMEETFLGEVFSFEQPIIYSYDYGCGWEIRIDCLDIETTTSIAATCLDGAGDWPPDDGWSPTHEAEHFDIKQVNKRLKRWKTMRRIHKANRKMA